MTTGFISSPESMYHAAIILKHTPQYELDSKLISVNSENHLLAYFLAKAAFEKAKALLDH